MTFDTPRDDATYGARITLPPGYHLCGLAGSDSSLEWYYVMLDPGIRCERLRLPAGNERMPDFVLIGHNPDTAFQYKATDDYVKAEPFYCHGMSYDYKMPHSISNAPTSIIAAGKILAGLDTVACIRQDDEKGRYSKAFLAYRPKPDDTGHGYEIAAYVHTKNKRQADKLVEQIAKSFKLLD